jgi:hypothetical protein
MSDQEIDYNKQKDSKLYALERIQALQLLLAPHRAANQSLNNLEALYSYLRKGNNNEINHYRAIRKKIEDRLLREKEGPILITHFHKQCEITSNRNPLLFQAFLQFLFPLCFTSISTIHSGKSGLNGFPNALDANHNLSKDLPSLSIASTLSSLNAKNASHHEKSATSAVSSFSSLHFKDLPTSSSSEQSKQHQLNDLKKIDLEIINDRFKTIKNRTETTNQQQNNSEEIEEATATKEKTLSHLQWIEPTVERKLIVDLIYILGGINGNYIKYDIRSESYLIDPSLQIPSTVRDIVLCICELGWLYTRVNSYRELVLSSPLTTATSVRSGSSRGSRGINHTASSSSALLNTKGLVIQAFAYALNVSILSSLS